MAAQQATSSNRVVVGLSGGVDSAVTAWLLREQGWDVVGLFMKNWEDDDDDEYCSTRQDWLDAASVADVIGIDLEAVNFAAEYRDRVFSEFLREYSAGRTPNPDVLCNAEIKFKAFLDHATSLGAAHIATGHYARMVRDADGHPHLLRGVDPAKDQSYFLHRLTREQLDRAMFPLGGMRKTEVRELAARIGLPNAAKRDSTGICFIGERPFRDFLRRYLPTQPGPMVDDGGRVVGEHVGLSFYTIGQRKGIGVGGDKAGNGGAWYVAGKDMATNTLTIVQGHDHPMLLTRQLLADDAHWIAGTPPQVGDGGALGIKSRYRQADAPGRVACDEEMQRSGRFAVTFDDAQWAVTPGQSAVVYRGDECLGGGVITAASVPDRSVPDGAATQSTTASSTTCRHAG